MQSREAHSDLALHGQQESARFCVKWGGQGSFSQSQAAAFLSQVESYWDHMTGPLGFNQDRGWYKEKRGTHKANLYIVGTGLPHPGEGCYLGCDPEGIHYVSTSADYPTLSHELGHLAEMGTYGFINNAKVGWTWESCSQWMLYYFHNDKPPGILKWLDQHHRPLDDFECRYESWLFFHYLQNRFGQSFVGKLWSMAQQDELPFAAVQRAVPSTPFPDIFADFAARCSTWDIQPAALDSFMRNHAGDQYGWSRFVTLRKDGDGSLRPTDRRLCWFGFHVLDLRPWVSQPGQGRGQSEVAISVRTSPHSADWRIAFIRVQRDGRMQRWTEGWLGERRQYEVSSDDSALMLVVCPAGRHDDEAEAPQYSVSLQPACEDWACTACTYRHEGRQNQFLACAVCNKPR